MFAIGIATGVVQEFEVGTNWPAHWRFVGNIFGSLQERVRRFIPWLMGIFAVMGAATALVMIFSAYESVDVYADIWPIVCPLGSSSPGVLAFGPAGLGCSALLPLTISFGQKELTAVAASVGNCSELTGG